MALIDMYSDLTVDYTFDLTKFIRQARDSDPAVKKELKEKLTNEVIQPFFGHIESRLKKSGTGFLVGDKLSFVDLGLFRLVEMADDHNLNSKQMILEKFPLVRYHFKMISDLPNISNWIRNREDYLY